MKNDYLKECLSDLSFKIKKSIPIDQFSAEFCVYCLNNSCVRSGSSALAFDRRVSNWESKYFLNVVRASDTDPSYDSIRGKWFKPDQVEIIEKPKERTSKKHREKTVKIETKVINKDVEDTIKEGLNKPYAKGSEPDVTPSIQRENIEPEINDKAELEVSHTVNETNLRKTTKKPKKTPKPKKPKINPDLASRDLESIHSEKSASQFMKPVPNHSSNAGGNTQWQNAGFVEEKESSEIVVKPGGTFTFGG